MKRSFLILIFLFSCSKEVPLSSQIDDSGSQTPAQILEEQIEELNTDLALKTQYQISSDDIALLQEEEILTEEELAELKKLVN